MQIMNYCQHISFETLIDIFEKSRQCYFPREWYGFDVFNLFTKTI